MQAARRALPVRLDSIVSALERAAALDHMSDRLAALVDKVLPEGAVRDLASGTPIGHPLHPLLVALPIGSWSAATFLDLRGGDPETAKTLVGLGAIGAVAATAAGANDWLSTAGAERRVGLAHGGINTVALMFYLASWRARGRGRTRKGAVLAICGLSLTSASGWLGGHLAYALGVGVDTTSFQHFPSEWVDVGDAADIVEGRAVRTDAGGTPLLLTRVRGQLAAIGDRCTHRGGPLHEGEIAEGCVTCPWHSSRFSLSDGTVKAGPATRPAPVLEVRTEVGRVLVRRADEPRSLRTRPVGP